MRERLRSWAVLMRLEYAVLGTVAIMGGLAAAAGFIPWPMFALLYVINCLIVTFGFIHNDLADEAIDRRGRDIEQRPLLSGRVSRREAWLLAFACLAAGVVLHVVFIRRGDSFAAMMGGYLFAALYNSFGKRVYGSDLLYGTSAACVALFGFLSIRDPAAEPLYSAPLAIAFAVATFANNTFLNAIPGGLKDVGMDRKSGVRTFAILSGVTAGEFLVIPAAFRAGAWALRILALGACWYPVAAGVVLPSPPLLLCMGFVSIGATKTTADLLRLKTWDRERIGKLARRQEFVSRILFLFVMAAHADWLICAIVVVAPVLCYTVVSRLVHKAAFHNPPTF